jgi:hypothetical protein
MSLDISLTLYPNILLSYKNCFCLRFNKEFPFGIYSSFRRNFFRKNSFVSSFVCLPYPDEIFYASVIFPFDVICEVTRWKFVIVFMILDTFTTDSFSVTRVGTITYAFVFLNLTFCHSLKAPTNFLN